jgi:hypothetical protein
MVRCVTGTYAAPAHGWTCFHCGETFTTPGAARDHFGATPEETPGCVLKVEHGGERGLLLELRKTQQELTRLRDEISDESLFYREYYAKLASDIPLTGAAFRMCSTLRDVFNVYDSMEGRAIAAEEQLAQLRAQINTPHTREFLVAVQMEAIHQRERWTAEHDHGKSDADWFWLIGYLAGKALHAAAAEQRELQDNDFAAAHGHFEKRLHHVVTTAAACLNWHAMLAGADTRMRPGIQAPKEKTG